MIPDYTHYELHPQPAKLPNLHLLLSELLAKPAIMETAGSNSKNHSREIPKALRMAYSGWRLQYYFANSSKSLTKNEGRDSSTGDFIPEKVRGIVQKNPLILHKN